MDEDWIVVEATVGEEYQQYVDKEGLPVPEGEPVGIEKGDDFRMLDGIYYGC